MNIKHNIFDLRLRVEALELLLISRGETDRENLESFRKEAQENYSKARDEFRKEQWAKIKPGSVINYKLAPLISLSLEVISISPNPFGYIAGKILGKNGKSGYRVGEIFTTQYPCEMELKTYSGIEIISMEE